MENTFFSSKRNELYEIKYDKEALEKLKKLKFIKAGSYFLMGTSVAILLKYWCDDSNALLDGISSSSLMAIASIENFYSSYAKNKIYTKCKKRVL